MGLYAEAGTGDGVLVAGDRNRLPPDGTVARVSGAVFVLLRCEQVRRATDAYRAVFFPAVRGRCQSLAKTCRMPAVSALSAG